MGYEKSDHDEIASASALSSISRIGSAPTSELSIGSPGRIPLPWMASKSFSCSYLSLILRESNDFFLIKGLQIGNSAYTQKSPHGMKFLGHSARQIIPEAKSESMIGIGWYFSAHIRSLVVRP